MHPKPGASTRVLFVFRPILYLKKIGGQLIHHLTDCYLLISKNTTSLFLANVKIYMS